MQNEHEDIHNVTHKITVCTMTTYAEAVTKGKNHKNIYSKNAYDSTWRYGIMKNLHDMGFRGNLPL